MKNERSVEQMIDWRLLRKEIVAEDSAYQLKQTKRSPHVPVTVTCVSNALSEIYMCGVRMNKEKRMKAI